MKTKKNSNTAARAETYRLPTAGHTCESRVELVSISEDTFEDNGHAIAWAMANRRGTDMTRQKKESVKKIDKMEQWIAMDAELGCGFAPAEAYDGMYREIYRFQEELTRLQHCASVEDMLYDTRGYENRGGPW